MSAELALSCTGLGKRYGSRWALRDCTLEIPAGTVTALVGPNGAGKTTLLQLAVGLTRPTAGDVSVLGLSPRRDAAKLLPRLGFVAQEHPLYKGFSVAEMLRLGRELNPSWDNALALERIRVLGLPPGQKVGKLSGGQQAQVALTLALAKRPDLLVLDEPVAALDPLARREFMQSVMEAVAESGMTVILSSHIVADLERVCDHLVILSTAEVQLAGEIESIVGSHRVLTGPRADPSAVARVHEVIRASHTPRQTTLLVRANGHVYDTCWEQHEVDLEEIVLAYLGYDGAAAAPPMLSQQGVAS
jgi:ABC-2 type transport system ATP-binding protein